MNISLKQRNVLVTGGAGGIGAEIVKSMYSLGANVLISGSNEQKLEKLSNNFSNPLSVSYTHLTLPTICSV